MHAFMRGSSSSASYALSYRGGVRESDRIHPGHDVFAADIGRDILKQKKLERLVFMSGARFVLCGLIQRGGWP